MKNNYTILLLIMVNSMSTTTLMNTPSTILVNEVSAKQRVKPSTTI